MTKIRTNIHLTEDQIKKLTRLAKKEKVTRAEMIRRSIDSLAEKRIGAISICSNAQSRIYCRIPSTWAVEYDTRKNKIGDKITICGLRGDRKYVVINEIEKIYVGGEFRELFDMQLADRVWDRMMGDPSFMDAFADESGRYFFACRLIPILETEQSDRFLVSLFYTIRTLA